MLRLPLCFLGKKGGSARIHRAGEGGNQCRLRCISVWTCGCGLRVLGGVQAQKLLEQEYDRLELQLKPQMNHSFSSE